MPGGQAQGVGDAQRCAAARLSLHHQCLSHRGLHLACDPVVVQVCLLVICLPCHNMPVVGALWPVVSRHVSSMQVALGCCQASGSGLTSALAGQVCSFRIAAHDANGNPIMTGGATFTVKVTCEGDKGLTVLRQSTGCRLWFSECLLVSAGVGHGLSFKRSSANSSSQRPEELETMLMLQARR